MIVFLQALWLLRGGAGAAGGAGAGWLGRLARLLGLGGAAGWGWGWARGRSLPDSEGEELAGAEYDEERGVVFYPPVYAQRYAAVSDLLRDPRWAGCVHKVVDLGYHDISFIKYLKEVPGIHTILGVDIEMSPLHCSKDLFSYEDYVSTREDPLKVVLFQGNAADPDYRLIGCDAVVAIEMIEHMLPHDLERLVHTVFGFIKPWVAIFTTPNADFNVLFKSMEPNGLRRWDHHFEWTREQFNDWCSNIVLRYPQYTVSCKGIGPGPSDTAHLGCCSQLAIFIAKDYKKQMDLTPDSLALITKFHTAPQSSHLLLTDLEGGDNNLAQADFGYDLKLNCSTVQVRHFSERSSKLMANTKLDNLVHTREVISELRHLTQILNLNRRSQLSVHGQTIWNNICWGDNAPYWNQYYTIVKEYEYPFESKSTEQRILDLLSDEIHRIIDLQDDDGLSYELGRVEIPLERLMNVVKHLTDDIEKVKDILEWNGYEIVDNVVIHSRIVSDEGSSHPGSCHDAYDWPDTSTDADVNRPTFIF